MYCDPPSHLSLTGVVHAPRLWEHFRARFVTTNQFRQDCADGTLPTYSFIEPNLLYGHNDMHPAFDALFPDTQVVPAPRTGGAPGQLGFGFQRSGVRTPATAVSPWIPAQTLVTDHYRTHPSSRPCANGGRWVRR